MSAQFYLSILNPTIALAFSGIVALLWRRWPGHTHLFPLSIAFLYLGLAFITEEWPLLSEPAAINYAGNGLFFAAVMLACISALIRVRAKVPAITFAAITVLSCAGFLYFALVQPSTLARVMLLNGSFALTTALTIRGLVSAGVNNLADRLFIAGVALGTILAIGRPVLILVQVLDINAGGPIDQSSYWGSVAGLTPFLAILIVAVFVFALVFEIVTKLQREAAHDHLTGLFNRRGFEAAVTATLDKVENGPALFVADIDNFKQVNDQFGHATGDQVIAAVGHVLARYGQSDFAGRIGGEEFALFYREASAPQLQMLAQGVSSELSRHRIPALPEGYRLTISIGLYRREGRETLDEMLVLADRALYRAKSAGKNRAVLSPARLRSA